MTDNIILEIKNLKKSFKDVKALQGISFKVKKGELFAFLGLNGAGKSTAINIILKTIEKDSGCVLFENADMDENFSSIIKDIGVVFQSSTLDKPLTVRENLRYRASLYGINDDNFNSRLKELSSLLGLDEFLDRAFSKLSGGQKRKADIARALLHNPKLLILDEPTTGLDPKSRQTVWEVINKLRQENNVTVLLTTHYMEEANDADYVVILDSGNVVARGTPLSLKNSYSSDYLIIYTDDEEQIKSLNYPYVKVVGGFKLSVPSSKIAKEIIQTRPELFENFEVVKGKMDDVFLAVTGKSL